ncbi:MAG: EamA family transporter [Clostridia bacterium]|nr:EamA family transporter [Clostridia bacterium]
MLALSMLVFGTIAPFVEMTGLASGEVALYRAVMGALLIAVFLLVTRQKIPFKQIKKQIPLLMISGGAMGFNWILLFEAYKYCASKAVATLCYYFAPVIVTLVCPILFKEKMTLKAWICFVMSTLGLALITGIGRVGDYIGIVFGIGAAVLYASVVLLNKYIKGVDGIHRTFLQFIAAIVVLIPYVAFTDGFNFTTLDTKGLTALLVIGFVHTGITYCVYFSTISMLSGQKASILSYIDPLVAVIISVAYLKEPMEWYQWVGGALILGFTLLNEIKFKKTIANSK